MPAGIQIVNSWGTVQIDENYRNYMLQSKTPTATGYVAGHDIFGFEVYTSSPLDIVAVQSSARFCLHGIEAYGAGLKYIFAVEGNAISNVFKYTLGVSTASNYGFQVYDAFGRLVYDAVSPALRVHTVLSSDNYENYLGDHVFVPGREFAVAFGAWCGSYGIDIEDTGSGGPIRYEITFWKTAPAANVISGGISFTRYSRYWNRVERRGTPPPPVTTNLKRFQAMIVDVTYY